LVKVLKIKYIYGLWFKTSIWKDKLNSILFEVGFNILKNKLYIYIKKDMCNDIIYIVVSITLISKLI